MLYETTNTTIASTKPTSCFVVKARAFSLIASVTSISFLFFHLNYSSVFAKLRPPEDVTNLKTPNAHDVDDLRLTPPPKRSPANKPIRPPLR